MQYLHTFLLGASLMLLAACGSETVHHSLDASKLTKATPEQVEALVAQFIEAKEGSTIEMPAGFYELTTQLILDNVNNVTIKGAGMYETVLSFKTLTSGGEGVKIAGNGITLEGFTVIDAPGDDIKTQHCENLTFRKVNTTWSHDDLAKSGTYGIYPVQCKNVLIEECEVSHSRDAGIYVGQSENIIVRNNNVFENVAGIEIENSDNAEVYKNNAHDNTAGILVFNLPGLPKAAGSRTRVFDNIIKENNHSNFSIQGPSENGDAITMIPPGTGVVVLAGDQVEVFDNKILNHKTVGVAIINYQITQLPIPVHAGWSPYTKNVFVHNNTYERTTGIPDITKDLGKLITAKCMRAQDLIYDGITDDAVGTDVTKNPMTICIKETSADFRFSRLVLPATGGLMDISVANDVEHFNACGTAVATDVKHIN